MGTGDLRGMSIFNLFKKKKIAVSEENAQEDPASEAKEVQATEGDTVEVHGQDELSKSAAGKSGKSKRKTLPKDLEEYITDDEAVKAVFEKCDINAYGTYNKGNIFSYLISEDMIKWCIEQGADINYIDRFGSTPLMHHLSYANKEHEKEALLLIANGADIHYTAKMHKESAIFKAVQSKRIEAVEALIAAGADLYQKNLYDHTPLENAFCNARPIDIPELVPVTELLLGKGVPVTETLKAEYIKAAKDVEFRRSSINPDFVPRLDAALDRLYELLDVERVPRRQQYDGKSEIRPKSDTWQKQHAELWELLVPGSGHASTVQGEVIRISGKVCYEILDNGCMNWDSDYQKLVKAFVKYLDMGQKLSDEERAEIAEITKGIKDRDEKDLNRLTELGVKWVTLNPMPIALESVEYKR